MSSGRRAPPLPPHGRRRARGVRIRAARLADVPAIAAVMREAIRALARGGHGPRQLAAWSSLPPLYHAWAMTAGGESYLVAVRSGRVVGYAALRRGEVTAAFVRPSAARRGIGAALLRRLERHAARAGAPALRVRAALPAVPFYEAMGFRGGRRIRVPLPGGATLPARALSKPVGGRPAGRSRGASASASILASRRRGR